jgi:hypothetical protein
VGQVLNVAFYLGSAFFEPTQPEYHGSFVLLHHLSIMYKYVKYVNLTKFQIIGYLFATLHYLYCKEKGEWESSKDD